MTRWITVFLISFALCELLNPNESQAKISKKSRTRDVYPATEPDLPLRAPKPRVISAEKAEPRLPIATQAGAPSYDPVPSDQVDPLVKRLKIVQELIEKHARAYDYRIYTTKQLLAILDQLTPKTTPTPPPSENNADRDTPKDLTSTLPPPEESEE
ncbi:MAG TPA: hypothetical protein VJB59_00620 [Bdellovibrionota bacterium]|nr:hypothetical protein [Bdellovibrionota bacterium]